MKIKKNTIVISIIFFIHISIALMLFITHINDYNTFTTKLLTYDSFLYRYRAIEFATSNFSILGFIKAYGINYSVISIFGSIAYYGNKFHDWLILIINFILLFLIYEHFRQILKYLNLNFYYFKTYIIYILLFLYLPFSTIMLNKEIIGFLFMSMLIYYYLSHKHLIVCLLGVIFGIFRIQYFVIVIYLYIFRFLLKRSFLLAFLLINALTIKFIHPMVLQWASHVGNVKIHSLHLMLILEKISYYPIVGILSNILRILISLLVGLKAPLTIITAKEQLGRFIYLESIFILSIISSKFLLNFKSFFKLFKRLKSNKLLFTKELDCFILNFDIIFVYLSIHSMVPFLQPRYYLPIIFCFILTFLIYNKIKNQIYFLTHNNA